MFAEITEKSSSFVPWGSTGQQCTARANRHIALQCNERMRLYNSRRIAVTPEIYPPEDVAILTLCVGTRVDCRRNLTNTS